MADLEDHLAPEAVQSTAQSRMPPGPPQSVQDQLPAGAGVLYVLGPRLTHRATTRPHQRHGLEPLYRPLSIFARDPSTSKLHGAIASVKLPYEPLEPGPIGSIIEVDSGDVDGRIYPRADLDARDVLLSNGYTPSITCPQFHQQMVYAVAMLTYANFKAALGRDVAFAFGADNGGQSRLKLRPFGAMEKNAWYDRSRGEIVFGYFTAEYSTPVAQAGVGKVYTSLSHDIIVHEMSHALLDGLRAHFFEPTHPDVLALHEAFADLIAFFQHFAYEDVVRAALSETRGRLTEAKGLISLAQEFGRGIGAQGDALRTFAGIGTEGRLRYAPDVLEPHDRGRVLSYAVFSAFETIYHRRTRRLIKLATGGSGVLPEGDLSRVLEDSLVKEARKLASQFLRICIRAIDYCPPVDVQFGDYLRALITADHDLLPDDDLAYRETIIRAFGESHIFGIGAESMTEDALLWRGPRRSMPVEAELKLASLRLTDDLSEPQDVGELRRLAGALGRLVTHPAFAPEFGLISPLSPDYDTRTMALPVVESIRIARRIGPDMQLAFDVVAEVTQRIMVEQDGIEWPFYGGSTIILDSAGSVRFVISKRVDNIERQQAQWEYMRSGASSIFWRKESRRYVADFNTIQRRLCAHVA